MSMARTSSSGPRNVEMRSRAAAHTSKRIRWKRRKAFWIERPPGTRTCRLEHAFVRAARPKDEPDVEGEAGTLQRALETATDITDGVSNVMERLFARMKWADEKMENMATELEEREQAVADTQSKLAAVEQDRMREREEWSEREAYLLSKMEQIQSDADQVREMLHAEKENTSTLEKARAASVQEVMKVLARMRDMEFNFKEKEQELSRKLEEAENLSQAVMEASDSVKDMPAGDGRLARELAALQKASIIAAREHFDEVEMLKSRVEKAEAEVQRVTLDQDSGATIHSGEERLH